jgi:hypothetical protein
LRCYGGDGLGAVCTYNRIDSKRLKLACGVVADSRSIDNRERQHLASGEPEKKASAGLHSMPK